MPETTVVSPAAVVPADRLTLGSCDARVDNGLAPNVPGMCQCGCFADEVAAPLASIMSVSCYCHANGSEV